MSKGLGVPIDDSGHNYNVTRKVNVLSLPETIKETDRRFEQRPFVGS